MSNHRYHIHIVCTAHDQPLILDSLAVFFQKTAFLTYDVANRLSQSSLYNRQSVENCDYVIVVIGDNYGASGSVFVSQMHLSYLSAKAKLKPMLILIKTHDEKVQLSWQLSDFTSLVERQSNHIYYYNDSTDIEQLLKHANRDILNKSDITAEWVSRSTLATLSDHKKNAHSSSIKNNSSPSTSSKRELSYTDASEHIVKVKNTTLNNSRIERAKASTDTDTLTTAILLTETIELMCSAQAYEGGNLSDITISTTLTWQQILTALAKIPVDFSSYGLQSCLNRLIASNIETEIKAQMPNVHAVSRCSISENDLNRLQRLLVAANWIQIVATATRTTQELWKLTFYAQQLYDEQL